MWSTINYFIQGRFWNAIVLDFQTIVFIYGTTLLIAYGILAILSLLNIRKYIKKNDSVDFGLIIESPLAPGISVIAPAYNEGVTIVQNVRSLLTLNYPKYEVILINDGSTDDTLEKLIQEFNLIQIEYAFVDKLNFQPIKRIFKSVNPAYAKLIVVDKINGKSKADASNAGINIASFDYFLCTDVDCILEKNTLTRLIKPFMDAETTKVREIGEPCPECGYIHVEEDYRKVIAVGATLRMVNSCEVDGGVITRVRPPKRLLPRFQEMEYIRAFVLGKMGWDFINAVPNVSGGLGMFDKEIVIKSGGYDSKSYGEDMDLTMRMITLMKANNKKYSVKYVPNTQCWTEGPSTMKVFARQRTRWGKGLVQIMVTHRKVFFNPKFGNLGLIVFPYTFFFEFLAPFFESAGILFYIYLIITNEINWPFAIILLIFVYTYTVMITTLALLWDQITFKYYKTWKEVLGLCAMAFIEPIFYHPLILFFSILGYFNFITGKETKWGNMQRQGFGGDSKRKTIASSTTAS